MDLNSSCVVGHRQVGAARTGYTAGVDPTIKPFFKPASYLGCAIRHALSSGILFSHPTHSYRFTMASVADEVAEDYRLALEDLSSNMRFEISNLTVIARENTEHALAIADVLQKHILKVGNV